MEMQERKKGLAKPFHPNRWPNLLFNIRFITRKTKDSKFDVSTPAIEYRGRLGIVIG